MPIIEHRSHNNTTTNMGDADAEEDPFACFDDESDSDNEKAASPLEEDEANRVTKCQTLQSNVLRDDGCGVLAFHAGTEAALLNYIRGELAKDVSTAEWLDGATVSDGAASMTRSIRRAETVLNLIDNFCIQRHWMMHIGKEKGAVLQKFISECLGRRKLNNERPPVFVELGTYCGYSSIFFVKTVLEEFLQRDMESSTTLKNFQIYTMEVVEHHVQVAQEIVRLSGLESYVDIILLRPAQGETLSSKLKEHTGTASIDFLFIDHDKSLYLQDYQELEAAGMIRKGTFVAADNVIFAKIDDYRTYMARLAAKGVIVSRLEEGFLEYSKPERMNSAGKQDIQTKQEMLKDGIELSIVIK